MKIKKNENIDKPLYLCFILVESSTKIEVVVNILYCWFMYLHVLIDILKYTSLTLANITDIRRGILFLNLHRVCFENPNTTN